MILRRPDPFQSEISSNIRLKTLKTLELELRKIRAFRSFHVNHQMACTRQFLPFLFGTAGLEAERALHPVREATGGG